MLFDTHTHTQFEDYDQDHDDVIRRALSADTWMINVGTDLSLSQKAVALAHQYEEGVYASVGLHPNDVVADTDFALFEKLAKDPKVVGIGECGLDYYRTTNQEAQETQRTFFIKHVELAKKLNKPLIIHCRNAHHDLLPLLKRYAQGANGVMHFFGGEGAWENARAYLDMGFYISFSGVVTFAKYGHEADIKSIPLERLLIETDAPFAAPEPHRGKRNEPSFVARTAEKLAAIKGVSMEELAAATTQNARMLFGV